MGSQKTILIGLPNSTGDTKNDWSAMLSGICMYLTVKGYNVEIIGVDRSLIEIARNTIIEIAQEKKKDWVFFLDDDTYVEIDAVWKMIQLDKDICSPPVADRKGEKQLNVLNEGLNRVYEVEKTEKVTAIGMACTLIKCDVSNSLLKEYATPFEFGNVSLDGKKIPVGEDVNFCLRAGAKGYETWCIKGIKTWHRGEPKKYTYEG